MHLLAEIERILIVDDEEAIRKLLARLLGAHGYECVTAESVAVARRHLHAEAFALLLSDVNMPGESGFDFAHEVHLDYPDTAVVLVTGVDDRRIVSSRSRRASPSDVSRRAIVSRSVDVRSSTVCSSRSR